jgi:protoheme IX farnesyltransferase
LSLALLPPAATLFLVLSHISYVNVYTPLKRRTPFCTLAGAVPGALPVLAGWSATGEPVTVAALALTSVLFLWQIPHFLALAWMAREDYARAGCPMLGVIDPTGRLSARISCVYALAMLFSAVVLAAAASLGAVYAAVGVASGLAYVVAAGRFARRLERAAARDLFLTSLLVLPVLLGALVMDLTLAG